MLRQLGSVKTQRRLISSRNNHKKTLMDAEQWGPYFQTLIDILENVLSKSGGILLVLYPISHRSRISSIGRRHCATLLQNCRVDTLMRLKGNQNDGRHMSIDQSMQVRTPYYSPCFATSIIDERRRFIWLNIRPGGTPPC